MLSFVNCCAMSFCRFQLSRIAKEASLPRSTKDWVHGPFCCSYSVRACHSKFHRVLGIVKPHMSSNQSRIDKSLPPGVCLRRASLVSRRKLKRQQVINCLELAGPQVQCTKCMSSYVPSCISTAIVSFAMHLRVASWGPKATLGGNASERAGLGIYESVYTVRRTHVYPRCDCS